MERRIYRWRDSARPTRLWGIDARVAVALFAWLLFPSLAMFAASATVMAFLAIAERRGYRPGAALRVLRRRLGGKSRAVDPRRYRRLLDRGAI